MTGKKDYQKFIAPRLRDFIFSKLPSEHWLVEVHVEKISLLSLGMSRRNLEKWLEKAWFNKDNIISNKMLLEEMKQQGNVSTTDEQPREKKRIFRSRKKD